MPTAPPPLQRHHALFLDFDGTLAPLQDDPDSVRLPVEGEDILSRAQDALGGALAVISGRSLPDLSSRIPDRHWRIGAHGLDVASPGMPGLVAAVAAPEALIRALETLTSGHPGTRIEHKGVVVALHYRQAPEDGPVLERALQEILAGFPDYHLQSGKMVFEAKPGDANKGKALARMLQQAPFEGRPPVMIGDDTTDEDAMQVALQLGGYAIKVGEGASCAAYRLTGPDEVWAWLAEGVQ